MKEEIKGTTLSRNGSLGGPERQGPTPSPAGIASSRAAWFWGILIAVFFACWGFRSIGANNIVDTDGARHAMNGAFLHDFIARGKLTGIVPYAWTYYAHFPALSMPYHPPLFPMIESAFFFLFGVNVVAARLAIAIAVAISGILLFRLVVATHGSVTLAALSAITFLSLPYSLWLSSDVMLEFPGLVFTLLALHFLWKSAESFSMKYALAFAVSAAAAVWTKQQSVFLGIVPFLYVVLAGRWKVLKRPAIWVSALVFGSLLVALTTLSVPFHGVGINQAAPPERMHVFYRNLVFYVKNYNNAAGPAGVILIVAFVAALAGRLLPRRSTAFYCAWAASSILVLLFIGPYAARYLFFALPALIVLGYASLWRIMQRLCPGRERWAIASGVVVLLISLMWSYPPSPVYLRGPDEAAKLLATTGAHRILYCGGTDGNFIFSYRSERPGLDSVILLGDKLPRQLFAPSRFEEFAHNYGIEYIVLERSNAPRERQRHPWNALLDSTPQSMVLDWSVGLTSSIARWNGTLDVYRFTNPSLHPDGNLTMQMNMIGGTMDFKLGE